MNEDIREQVRKKYALAFTSKTGCCSTEGCCGGNTDATNAITENLYKVAEIEGLPQNLLVTSLGCGNPTALGNLYSGETVLDLGSGAGLDVLLSARRVGPHGKAYGLDMTEEMLAEANANKERSGIVNADFLKGTIENIPLPDNSVDVVISNCVINLSIDKEQVFREIFRVLRPGGRVAVSDIVLTKPLPEEVRASLLAWAGCVGGSLTDEEYRSKLIGAGFENIGLEITRTYDMTSPAALKWLPDSSPSVLEKIDGSIVSAFVRAKKPSALLFPGADFIIRAAVSDDYPFIHALLSANGLPPDGVAQENGYFFVAVQSDRLVGVIGYEQYGKQALLRSLAVDNTHRKAGIAEALVNRLLNEIRQEGSREVYLLTETAERYFHRRGFEIIPREEFPANILDSSALGQACPTTSICMKLSV